MDTPVTHDVQLSAATGRPTLLVVDDQPVNIRALAQAFMPDYRVLMATGGERALELCASQQPDLLLLDVAMPGMDGHEVCRRVKADPRTRDIPVIFVTSHDEASQEALGLQLGAVDFIAKPVNPAVVRGRVRTHIALRDASRQLQALNGSLERRIEERTRELALALEAARAAIRARTQFLSNVSHEFRTPINGVIGMSHVALAAQPAPAEREALEKILACGLRLRAMVDDVLDFALLQDGKLGVDLVVVDPAELCRDVVSPVAEEARRKGLALHVDVSRALPPRLLLDARRARQVLLAFLDNAVKFSAGGEVRVAVLPETDRTGEGWVRFEVSDHGIGMTPAQLQRAFEPFHQADPTATRAHGGNGLGLALARSLATLLGGDVGADSRPGEGSTFWLRLPLRRDDPAAADGKGADEPAPAATAPTAAHALRGARVLVVEDNALNRELVQALLAASGVLTEGAVDGREAVEKAAAGAFDAILMDVQMPVMDGLAATRAILAGARGGDIPIIALTANAAPEDRAMCLEAGMCDILLKPVLPNDLHATLVRWTAGPAAPAREAGSAANERGADPALDLGVLARTVHGDRDKFAHFARLFVTTVKAAMAEVDEALAQGDQARLADLGHRLKSSARMVGALGFASICESLEEQRDSVTLAPARAIVGALPGAWAHVAARIDEELE